MPKKVNIVIVDDDESVRDLVADVLIHLNASVARFDNAITAWEHIKSTRTDIVISDVHMEEMEGLELLNRVKRSCPHRKCIMISGDPTMESPALGMGADAFLQKPFNVNALLVAVAHLLEPDST